MAHFVSHGPVSNQVGTQVVHGNIVFRDAESSRKRLRRGGDGSNSGDLDDEILDSLRFPQMFQRRSDIETAHPQTCQWLSDLDEFQKWKTGNCGLLWIKGKPGSGKSTLVSHLYRTFWLERQKDNDVHLEFFFSARGVPLQRTFVGMLRSLLFQLFTQDPAIRQVLRAAYIEKCSSFGSSSWEWTVSDLRSLFQDMFMRSAQHKQVMVLIDALDEAGEETAEKIATFFHAINDSVMELSDRTMICISCRHYPIPSRVNAVEIWIESHNRHDIALYVEHYLRNGDVIIDASQQNIDKIVNALVEKADGVFQWVRLVISQVVKWLREGDTTEQTLRSVSQVPKDLEDVYQNILMNIIDRRHEKTTLQLFQWVCLARRPLSLLELRHALDTDHVETRDSRTKRSEGSDEIIRRRIAVWSGGLLEIRAGEKSYYRTLDLAEGETVQVIHQSVNDFMIARGLAVLLARNIDNCEIESSQHEKSTNAIKISHGVLYRSCLNYLCLKISYSENSILGEVEQRYPFFGYATRFVLTHAEQSDIYRGLDPQKESQLLNQSLPIWNLIYNNRAALFYNYIFSTESETVRVRSGCTVLYLASIANLIDLAKYRIECGDDINERDISGWTAICAAASRGHRTMTVLLHRSGADINNRAREGETPLVIAAGRGHIETFRYLLHHGSNINEKSERHGSALHAAAAIGNVTICRFCIEAGADVNAVGGEYGTALQAAASKGNKGVVKLLLEAGAHVNAVGGRYGTALQAAAAAYKENEGVVKLLLEAGADDISSAVGV